MNDRGAMTQAEAEAFVAAMDRRAEQARDEPEGVRPENRAGREARAVGAAGVHLLLRIALWSRDAGPGSTLMGDGPAAPVRHPAAAGARLER